MAKKYIVDLSGAERDYLEKLTTIGRHTAQEIIHARILLKASENQEGGAWKDQAIAQALDVGVATVERVRRRFVEEGLEATLKRKLGAGRKERRLDGKQEAQLIALACSNPPTGRGRWTLRLLATKMVELEYLEALSHETVRQTLKKTNCNLGRKNVG